MHIITEAGLVELMNLLTLMDLPIKDKLILCKMLKEWIPHREPVAF